MSESDWNEPKEGVRQVADGPVSDVETQKTVEAADPVRQQNEMMQTWLMETLKEQRRTRRWKLFFRFFRAIVVLVALVFFWQSANKVGGGDDGAVSGDHVAVVNVLGQIGEEQEANADSLIRGIRAAFGNKGTRALILNINSPGGSPVHSGEVYDELLRQRSLHPDTPVYAVIRDMGASGAYYIAAGADEIYANRASLVGSIGVVSAGFGLGGLIEKIGVERRVFTSGENKAFLDPFTDMSDQQADFWQSVLTQTHQQFIKAVQDGRGDRLADNPEIFSGLVWSGGQAVDLGLIDGLASVRQVAEERVGVRHLVDFTPEPSPWKQISREMGVQLKALLREPQLY
ncbi:S49 family peptidase [Oceanospirillum linum]|uniref:S49 family peptidase n=1 Tax=Oceanospirillum linum TaxID=966 RepID=UPI0009825E43|nr:S49 family peptidase [Oceanospirillum linum]